MSDKTFELALLFDFFGDLLTEKQREYFDLYYNNDLSLSEISEMNGISRQGVRDNLLRAENTLRELEAKTGVVKKFREMQDSIKAIEADAVCLARNCSGSDRETAERILFMLQNLKG